MQSKTRNRNTTPLSHFSEKILFLASVSVKLPVREVEGNTGASQCSSRIFHSAVCELTPGKKNSRKEVRFVARPLRVTELREAMDGSSLTSLLRVYVGVAYWAWFAKIPKILHNVKD